MKRILIVLLVLAIIISSVSLVYGEAKLDVSNDVKSLVKIGMLDGGGAGVTIEYTQKEMDRITAAISILKLRGLYEDALKYKESTNFLDAGEVKWSEGRNLLAYIKTKGIFAGNEKGEFRPYEKISEAAYYKVLLETLGYKQIIGQSAGDFTWDKALEFARKLGLKPSGANIFTIDDLAKATVSALKAKNKAGKQYIVLLIEEKKIDKQKAIEAGLYEEPMAKAVSAKALGNTVVEVSFYSAVAKEAAEDMGRYSIEGLEIKKILYIDGKTIRITTSAQKSGQYYYVNAGGSSVKYKAVAKVSGAPAVKSIVSNESEKIVVEFDKVLDYVTATDTVNYAISGVDIIKAALVGKKVTLETSGLAAKRSYTLRFSDIKSVDGVSIGSVSKSFSTNVDIVPPGISEVKGESNQRVLIYFTEPVTKETAENIGNYYIKDRNGELAVYKAEFATTKKDTVRLHTEPQKTGTKYDITIQNMTDTSKNANTMDKSVTKYFYGVRGDTSPPVLVGAEAKILSLSEIQLVFTDESKFDEAALLDPSNYTVVINNRYKDEVSIKKAQKISYSSGKYKVKLTTDTLDYDAPYIVTAYNIADEYGNVLEKNNIVSMRTASEAPEVYNIYQLDDRSFAVEMSMEVKVIDSDGQVSAGGTTFTVRLDSLDKTMVKFISPVNIIMGKTYSFDLSKIIASTKGTPAKNASSYKTVFVGEFGDPMDTDKPYIYEVKAADNLYIDVEYSEDMGTAGTYSVKYIDNEGTARTLTIQGYEIRDSFVRIKLSSNTPMKDEYEYYLVLKTLAKDKAGNSSDHRYGEEFSIIK